MQPLFSKSTNEFYGLLVPLTQPSGTVVQRDVIYFSMGTGTESPEVRKAMDQLRTLRLHPTVLGQNVIGTVKAPKQIVIANTESYGVKTSNCGADSLCIGENIQYGFRIGAQGLGDLREQKGFSISDPVSSIVQIGDVLFNRHTAFEVVKDLIHLTSSVAPKLSKRERIDWPEKDSPILTSIMNAEMSDRVGDSTFSPVTTRSWERLFTELQKDSNLNQELAWKKYITGANQFAPLWNQIDAQKYIQSLCDRIQAPDKFPVRCRIFASLLPYAFSYPGGDVFVTAGFLASVPNEATLMFFLAHEMSHVYSRHFTQNIANKEYKTKTMNTISLVSQIISIPELRQQKDLNDVADMSIGHLYRASMTNYTQSNELEADQLAFEITVALGYGPSDIREGLKKFGQFLTANFLRTRNSISNQIGLRYPSLSARLEALSQISIPNQNTPALEDSRVFQDIQSRLRPPFDTFRYALRAQ